MKAINFRKIIIVLIVLTLILIPNMYAFADAVYDDASIEQSYKSNKSKENKVSKEEKEDNKETKQNNGKKDENPSPSNNNDKKDDKEQEDNKDKEKKPIVILTTSPEKVPMAPEVVSIEQSPSTSYTPNATTSPILHSGNDSKASAPSGYTHYSFGSNSASGTYTVRFDTSGNRDSNGQYYFTHTIGKLPGQNYTAVLTWSSNFDIYSVIVKGGSAYNEYVYNTARSGSYLVSPVNASGNPASVSHTSIIFKLEPKTQPKDGALIIYKKDGSGDMLPGATFTLTDSNLVSYNASDDGNGTFSWENLAPGEYTLTETVVPTGYYVIDSISKTITIIDAQTEKVTITNYTNEDEHCSLALDKIDSYGNLITSEVTFRLDGVDVVYTSTQTSTDGHFFWGDLESGEYTLTETSPPSGYYFESQLDNVVLVSGQTKQVSATNYEYITIQVQKTSNFTGLPLSGTEFQISGPNGVMLPMQISDPVTGIATFDASYRLKANVEYTVTEINPPTGYQNDSTPKQITVLIHGGMNALAEGNFQNTPILQSISVTKFINDVAAGTILDGTEFQLFQGTLPLDSSDILIDTQVLQNGMLTFSDLLPGAYIVHEVGGDINKNYTLDSDKQLTLELANKADTVTNISFNNTTNLGSILVTKLEAGTTNQIAGVEFSLYKDTVTPENKIGINKYTDSKGNCSWGNLIPGQYIIVEVTGVPGYVVPTDNTTNVIVVTASQAEVVVYNTPLSTPTPPTTSTPTVTPTPPVNTYTPEGTPESTPTPTPIPDDELIIEDDAVAFGAETGEGDGLFIAIGLLLLMAAALLILRKKVVLNK